VGSESGGLSYLSQGWKRSQVEKKSNNILAIFITVTLFFAIAIGLVKGFNLKDKLNDSRWDGKSSFLIAVDSQSPTLFVYQPELKRVAFLTLSKETVNNTEKVQERLASVSEAVGDFPKNLTLSFSHIYQTKVNSYINLSEQFEMDEEAAQRTFLEFTSLFTPIKLITYGWGDDIEDTNITRWEALRLWWQIKGISINDIIMSDLSKYNEEVLSQNNEKIMGADTEVLNRIIRKYVNNIKILEEKYDVNIINGSNMQDSAKLARNFVESIGGNVVEVNGQKSQQTQTVILATNKKSYTANYLANIFNCDIKEAKSEVNKSEITILLGVDFANQYFE